MAALVVFLYPAAAAADGEGVAEPARKLAAAAMFLPAPQREEVRHKALAIILLAEYGRLLPSGLSAGQWETLENLFLQGRSEEPARRRAAGGLPMADTIRFDGGRLDGGGFSRIDNIIGTDGRPIALDRRLPARLIPLNQGEENLLRQAATRFSAAPSGNGIRERTDALYRAQLDSHLVADGIFYRPYAGRTDDLFYRLVQENSTPSSDMNFYAIAESLPGRRYHPLTGIGASAAVPSPWFSVSEILSGGGLLAVEDFKSRNPRADVRNPFFGFAARILPFLGTSLETTRSGDELSISRDVIRSAIESTQRFTPKPVEPIFSDPARFFGFLTPRFLQVSRKMTRAEMAEEMRKIDFETPLPSIPTEPVANEVLVNPSKWTEAEFFQELPELLGLDSSPVYDPDADLFAGPPEETNANSPPPTASVPPVTLVQVLPAREELRQAAEPPAPIPLPPPVDKPLIASLPVPLVIAVEEANQKKVPPPEPAEAPPLLAEAAPTPSPVEITVPSETQVSALVTLEIPYLPLFSPDLLLTNSFLQPSRMELPRGAEPLPDFGPMMADDVVHFIYPTPELAREEAGRKDIPLPEAAEAPPLLAEATPSPAEIALPPETQVPELAALEMSPPPILSPDFLPSDSFLQPGSLELPQRAEPSPVLSPMLADEVAPAIGASPTPEVAQEVAKGENIPEKAALADATASPSPPTSLSSAKHYVAVVTPDISSSEKYLSGIAASDATLSKNAASLNRINSYLRWFSAALESLESSIPTGLAAAQKAGLQEAGAAAESELSSLLEQRRALLEKREGLLADRGRLRTLIEGEPLQLSIAGLDALLGRPVKVVGTFALVSLQDLPDSEFF